MPATLTEHFERGGASSEHGRPHPFWPWPKGSNEHKTELAAGVLETVLGNVRWENVLMLHSYVAIYEVRNSRGFGLRWTLNLEGESKGVAATPTPPSDPQLAAETTTAASNDNVPAMTEDKVPSGAATAAEKGPGEGEEESKEKETAASALRISRVVFRGFVEPILNLDHELPDV